MQTPRLPSSSLALKLCPLSFLQAFFIAVHPLIVLHVATTLAVASFAGGVGLGIVARPAVTGVTKLEWANAAVSAMAQRSMVAAVATGRVPIFILLLQSEVQLQNLVLTSN